MAPEKLSIAVLTYLVSPYQVEFFDSIQQSGRCDLHVSYLYSKANDRNWRTPVINHPHVILNDSEQMLPQVYSIFDNANLAIFNYYNHPTASRLIRRKVSNGGAWCFWGERTGFRHLGWLGTLYRHWKLRELHRAKVPIWGIGQFAIDRYQAEFGGDRAYSVLPYYSNLERFSFPDRRRFYEPSGGTTFLFVGSLSHRKGVDLLAIAFLKLLAVGIKARLRFVGDGDLRFVLEKKLKCVMDSVEFVGFCDWDGLPSEYRRGDILCAPSRYDGWALVVPEALASGMPVITTRSTGAGLEFIEDEINGWLVPGGDGESLFVAMQEAAQLNEQQYTKMSKCAFDRVRQHGLGEGVEKFISAAIAAIEQ